MYLSLYIYIYIYRCICIHIYPYIYIYIFFMPTSTHPPRLADLLAGGHAAIRGEDVADLFRSVSIISIFEFSI